eukprot:Nk52_evm38s1705 gene=Nk52_evmTU38s1705
MSDSTTATRKSPRTPRKRGFSGAGGSSPPPQKSPVPTSSPSKKRGSRGGGQSSSKKEPGSGAILYDIVFNPRVITFSVFFVYFFVTLSGGPLGIFILFSSLCLCMAYEIATIAGRKPILTFAIFACTCLHCVNLFYFDFHTRNRNNTAMQIFPFLSFTLLLPTSLWIGFSRDIAFAFLMLFWSVYMLSVNLLLVIQTQRIYYTLVIVSLTELSDAFQYICGRLAGRTKIVAKISPNKTLEGFVGGSIMTTGLCMYLGESLSLGLIISLGGIAGDLLMSSMKRARRIKDTSNILPGHGGMLDRLDSLLIAGPYAYLYLVYGEGILGEQ